MSSAVPRTVRANGPKFDFNALVSEIQANPAAERVDCAVR